MEIDKTYLVNSQRKGTFFGRLIYIDETWARFVIVAGFAKAIMNYNVKEVGDHVDVRRSLCTFTVQPEAVSA